MKREQFEVKARNLVIRAIKAQDCIDTFAHHEWIDTIEIEVRGVVYTAHKCHCGAIEIE